MVEHKIDVFGVTGSSPVPRTSSKNMEFPPKPKTQYVFDNPQDKRIFEKLSKFKDKKIARGNEELIKFLYSQLENDWRTPLEKFIDKLNRKWT